MDAGSVGSRSVGFGPEGEALAARFRPEVDAIVTDRYGIAEALHEAARRKRVGEHFFVFTAIEDERTAIAQREAARILLRERDFDARYEALVQLGLGKLLVDGRPVFESSFYTEDERRAFQGLTSLGSPLLTRSWTENNRLTHFLHDAPLYSTRALCTTAGAPRWQPRFGGSCVVIWAPHSDPESIALPAFGLEDLHIPVFAVTRHSSDATRFGLRARFIEVSQAESVLRDALAVVVADLYDPAGAIELAANGIPLAIPSTSGAHEYLDAAAVYFPWNARSVRSATLAALGSPPPRIRDDLPYGIDYAKELAAAQAPLPPSQPLVSIVVSTKNRRELLPRALDSVAAQTYPNIEMVVVNDGGEAIDDIVARYPSARLVSHDSSAGLVTRLREGADRVTGKYCVALSDDDYFFPDHFARCIYALERTGSVAARTMVLITFLEPGNDGRYAITGYDVSSRYAYDPTELLWMNNVTLIVQTREAISRYGLWRTDTDVGQAADWDCFLRLAQASDFPCIKVVTCNFDQRLDQTNLNGGGSDAWLRDVTALFAAHPVGDRPYIGERRAAALAVAQADDVTKLRPMAPPAPLVPPAPGEYAVLKRH